MHVCTFVHVHEWGEERGRVVQLLLQTESEEVLIYHLRREQISEIYFYSVLMQLCKLSLKS